MGLSESRAKDKETLKSQAEAFLSRLQIALIGCSQARNTFLTLSELWSTSRREAMAVLSEVADEIDRHHFNVNIANLTGTASSIAGGTAAIASFVAAPFSGGVSVALAAGGLFGTVAGTATTFGANITEVMLTKDLMEKVKKVLDTDMMYTNALSDAFRELVIHENDVLTVLAEIQNRSFADEWKKITKLAPESHKNELLSRFIHGENSFEVILGMLSRLYAEDTVFLNQLHKTSESLLKQMPSLAATLPTSCEFFQSLKELSAVGPETLKGISSAAMQSTVSTSASISVGAQLVTIGLGTIFVALDIYQLMQTSRNFDEGSKTELAEKIRDCVKNLYKEQAHIESFRNFFTERMANALSTNVL